MVTWGTHILGTPQLLRWEVSLVVGLEKAVYQLNLMRKRCGRVASKSGFGGGNGQQSAAFLQANLGGGREWDDPANGGVLPLGNPP